MPLPSLLGTDADFLARLKSVLPARWFGTPGTTPVLDAVMTGVADMLAWCWAMMLYVQAQARIATAFGNFLDARSQDFNGGNLPRFVNETDIAYRARIMGNMFAAKGTRAAVIAALTNLTGVAPKIFEPANTGDAGGWDTGGFAFDSAGGWGDTTLPFQFFVTAHHHIGGGIANVSGWDAGGGGWDRGAIEWTDATMPVGFVTEAAIQAAVAATKPAASIAWMQIT